jgi:hypothetical protein
MGEFAGDTALFKREHPEDKVAIFAVRAADLTYHVPEPIGEQCSAWGINPSVLKGRYSDLLSALRVPLSNKLSVNEK